MANLTTTEKIRILLDRRGRTMNWLAESLGMTRQNLSVKMKNCSYSQKELEKIAELLDCTIRFGFVMNDTGEEI